LIEPETVFKQPEDEPLGSITWSGTLLLYALLTMYLYPTMKSMDILGYMNELPEAMKAAFGWEGTDFAIVTMTPESFAAMEFLVLWPVMIGIYAIFSSIGIARETEQGTLDLLLAQPIKRYKIVISKFSVFIAAAFLLTVTSLLGLVIGATLIEESVNILNLARVLFEAFLFVIAVGSFALLCSVIFLEPRKSLLISGVVLAASYIINFVVPVMSDSISWVRNLSLFYFYSPNEVLNTAAINGTAVIIYLSVTVICFAAALIIFQRRDLIAA